jgi:hypothetical protein
LKPVALLCLLLLVIAAGVVSGHVKADQQGLYWSSATSADGVRVRRLDDTNRGIVCYVARDERNYPDIGISCVKVPQ